MVRMGVVHCLCTKILPRLYKYLHDKFNCSNKGWLIPSVSIILLLAKLAICRYGNCQKINTIIIQFTSNAFESSKWKPTNCDIFHLLSSLCYKEVIEVSIFGDLLIETEQCKLHSEETKAKDVWTEMNVSKY